MKADTSIVDPIPTCLFQSCFASLCPVVLSTGIVPAAFQIAVTAH